MTKMQLIEALRSSHEERAIDLIDLRKAGEPLLGQILQHGIRLKGSECAARELVSSRHRFLILKTFFPTYARITGRAQEKAMDTLDILNAKPGLPSPFALPEVRPQVPPGISPTSPMTLMLQDVIVLQSEAAP